MRFRRTALLGVFAVCWLVFLTAPLRARDYEVKVRLLDGKTGEAIPNKEVTLSLVHDDPGRTRYLRATTSPDGTAQFAFGDPLPSQFGYRVYGLRECAAHGDPPILADTVFEHGFVNLNSCDKKGKLKGKISASPGEIVVFFIPIAWWRHLIPLK